MYEHVCFHYRQKTGCVCAAFRARAANDTMLSLSLKPTSDHGNLNLILALIQKPNLSPQLAHLKTVDQPKCFLFAKMVSRCPTGSGTDHELQHYHFTCRPGDLLHVITHLFTPSFLVISLLSLSNEGIKYPQNTSDI